MLLRSNFSSYPQFLLLSTIFSYLMLDFGVKIRIRFSLRDKRLFEITEVEITRVDCILVSRTCATIMIEFSRGALMNANQLEITSARTKKKTSFWTLKPKKVFSYSSSFSFLHLKSTAVKFLTQFVHK